MVIRGNSRGNGKQLASYLAAQKDNEAIRIFEVDGFMDADADRLKFALHSMNLSSELSKSEKGLYHAQINPAPGELMNDDRWLQSVDILAKQLGMENQRRAIVLHTKKGRTHAHVVWERFDHDKGKMVSDSFSRLAQDRARKEMELAFNHAPTPHRNVHRPDLKLALTDLWQNTTSGSEFVKACKDNGYLISEGAGRTPFMVVDEQARSHNLVRQIKGVKLKEVRQMLRHEKLMTEKAAIEQARDAASAGAREKEKRGKDQARFKQVAHKYMLAKESIFEDQSKKIVFQAKFNEFTNNKDLVKAAEPVLDTEQKNKAAAQEFAKQKEQMLNPQKPAMSELEEMQANGKEQTAKPVDPRILELRKTLADIEEENKKNKNKGLDYD